MWECKIDCTNVTHNSVYTSLLKVNSIFIQQNLYSFTNCYRKNHKIGLYYHLQCFDDLATEFSRFSFYFCYSVNMFLEKLWWSEKTMEMYPPTYNVVLKAQLCPLKEF